MKYRLLKRVGLLTILLFSSGVLLSYDISMGQQGDRDRERRLMYYLGRYGGQAGPGLGLPGERGGGGLAIGRGLGVAGEERPTEGMPPGTGMAGTYDFTNSLTVKPGVRSLHLNWLPLEEQEVTYTVMWGLEARNYTNQEKVGAVNFYTITGLDPEKTYYVVVVGSREGELDERADLARIMTMEVVARPLKDTLSPIEREYQERLERELVSTIRRQLKDETRRKIKKRLDEELKKLEKKTTREITRGDIADLEERIKTEITEKSEKELAERVKKELEEKSIKQFRYDTFSSIVSSFAPFRGFPAPPDYTIGPGDRLTVYLWGGINDVIPVVVDRDGTINLPFVGSLAVSGLRFSELKGFLSKHFSRYEKLISVYATLDQLKSIQVFIAGEVQFPGSYQVSSLSTVYNALFASGGPTKKGSLRDIQLIRGDRIVSRSDLYDFLLEGKKSKEVEMQPGDTIFVPRIGPVIGITGEVKAPAIYEIKEDSVSLKELLELAGGISDATYLKRIQIERVIAHQEPVVMELDISPPEGDAIRTPLKDRDLVKVFSILMEIKNVVYLEGHVKRPGRYALKPGMKISDLIPSYDVLLPEPFTGYGEITRLVPPDYHSEVVSFNVGELLKGNPKENLELREQDRVVIFSEEQMKGLPKASVNGEVAYPGEYRLFRNTRVTDLIYMAGNLNKEAYLPRAEITRFIKGKKSVTPKQIYVNLEEALNNNPDHNILLQEDDMLFVRRIPSWDLKKIVTIAGNVKFPGDYSLEKGDRLSDLIERAGGCTEDAFIEGAYLVKDSARREQQRRFDEFVKELELRLNIETQKAAQLATSGEVATVQRATLDVRQMFIEKLKEVKVEGRVTINLAPLEELKGSGDDIVLEPGDIL
ncbi:MAG: SLBB domain-containing protein, partial [Pseudomonadota bacterium]